MPITIYGIKNCDTMKTARAWLEQHGVAYAFHDYKRAGIERERLERWSKRFSHLASLGHVPRQASYQAQTGRVIFA